MNFPNESQPETTSQNQPPKWDALSQRVLNGKIHPGIQLNSGTHFPNQVPSGNCIPFQTRIPGHAFRIQTRPHDVAFSLYMFSRCPHDKPRFNTEASARSARNVRFIASSARAGEHLMCSPCEQDCPSREPYVPRRRADEPVKTCRYLILVVPGARLGSVSLASVWKCSV